MSLLLLTGTSLDGLLTTLTTGRIVAGDAVPLGGGVVVPKVLSNGSIGLEVVPGGTIGPVVATCGVDTEGP